MLCNENLTTTEGEAVPEEVLEHLGEADIHEHGLVELVVVRLVDDVESVVKILTGWSRRKTRSLSNLS